MTEQYEIFRDPYRMLILLATLVSEQKGEKALQFDNVPYFENDTYLIQNEKFVYKKNSYRNYLVPIPMKRHCMQ
ncbi:hypothetical protein SAMN04487897_101508 [Paenibacillus sp. yr247]|uniref:hypothetical protein n=1 Tax=Paenibacillus sp. yr247 TaxID=1761880 RepID=UPI00088D3650|nr:hypothetical protein [Paenibacillus sp. yr247]SDM92633.1 hypothetical protein SAMN04487897_101508 [Paenibacillus sp. yr247]